KDSEQLGKSESLADLLRKKKKQQDGGLSEKQRAEAMQELARLTRQAMKDNPQIKKGLAPELQKELEDGGLKAEDLEKRLTPERLEKLKEALKNAKGDIQEKLGKLEKAGLIDPDKLKDAENAGKPDEEGLLAFLKECEGKCSVKEALAKM